jgi:hypothetical protein
MPVDWRGELAAQLDFYWELSLRRRLLGLTDDEYLWEPVEGCWTVRPAPDGSVVADWAWPPPDPPPFTTIAWRMWHIAVACLGVRASNHFGDGSLSTRNAPWSMTAAGAISLLEASYAAWKAGVDALDEAGLARAVGPAEGPFSEYPMASLILHINREVIHHNGEIGVLRDLYRDRHKGRLSQP